MMHNCAVPRRACALLALLGLFLAGCGRGQEKTFPATGTVKFADGSPLTGGMVEFLTTGASGQRVNARGPINEQGAFTLHTFGENDGAVAGEHQAIVVGPALIPSGDITKAARSAVIASRFQNYETSGLKYTVSPGDNTFAITVEKEN